MSLGVLCAAAASAAADVTVPTAAVYGGSYTPSLTVPGGPVNFAVDSATTGNACSLNGIVVRFTGVGTCMIDANPVGGGVTIASASFSVAKAPLTVNAKPITKNVGAADPAAQDTLSGFVFNTDNASNIGLTGAPACTIATHAATAGVYAGVVTCAVGTLSSPHYSFVPGSASSLTILDPPSVTIFSPYSGQTFNVGQSVPVSVSCADSANAPGLASCVDSRGLNGFQYNGTYPYNGCTYYQYLNNQYFYNGCPYYSGVLDTSTPGLHNYSITATSLDGQSSSSSVWYYVRGLPTAQITSPASGGVYSIGQVVPTSFSCSDSSTGTGISSCKDSGGASTTPFGVGTGSLDTSSPGPHMYIVTALSQDGLSGQATIPYTVLAAPTAQIKQPTGGANYTVGQAAPTSFSCVDDAKGPGIASCTDSNGATTGGGMLDTSTVGSHTYSVTAVSKDGEQSKQTVDYTVSQAAVPPPPKPAPPTVSVTSPKSGQRFTLGQSASVVFTCSEGANGPGLRWCADQYDGGSGAPLPTGTLGAHTIYVGAMSTDGLSDIVGIHYTVVPKPVVPKPKKHTAKKHHK